MCKRTAGERAGNPAWPFCSERCRLLDLGKWLDEDYRVPGEADSDGAETEEDPVSRRPPGKRTS
jgi:endogenous inhibitor of DNA gyrase (YacG/DUF329 family)